MAKRIATGSILFLLTWLSTAMPGTYRPLGPPDSTALQLHYGLHGATDAVPGKFAGKVLFGGYLDHALKQDAIDRLGDNHNLFGMKASWGMDFFSPVKGSPWQWSVHLSAHQLKELSFSRSAFHLVFFGNKPSTGEAYPFSLQYRELDYQLFQGGIHYRHNRHYGGIRLGPASGTYYFSGHLEEGTIYTHSDGQCIELMMQGHLHWSDTAGNKGFFRSSGLAGSITYGYETKNQKAYIALENLGVIMYNTHFNSNIDSTWHYKGVEANFFEDNNMQLNVNRDSLLSWSGARHNGRQQVLLPASLRVSFVHGIQDYRYSVALYGSYPLFSLARPQIWVVPGWKIHPNWKVMGVVSYGGYGALTTGLGLRASLQYGLDMELVSNNLMGMWLNNHPAAAHALVRVHKAF